MVLLIVLLLVPDPSLTPGVVRPISQQVVCSTAWGKDRRHVTPAMRFAVIKSYGLKPGDVLASGKGPCCELDHLIPRELGGADDVQNLWPQPWTDAHEKDKEENRLHVAVCAGGMTLIAAQDEMRQWGRK